METSSQTSVMHQVRKRAKHASLLHTLKRLSFLEVPEALLNPSCTLLSMANLAEAFRYQGRANEAEELEQRVLETGKAKPGPDHPETPSRMHNLACIWKSLGQDADASLLMEEWFQARQHVLGQDQPLAIYSSEIIDVWRQESV
jgi:hypothetical protein